MKTIFIVIMIAVYSVSFAGEVTQELSPSGRLTIIENSDTPKEVYKVSANCVDKKVIINSFTELMDRARPKNLSLDFTLCNSFECRNNGDLNSAEYYERRASEARKEAKFYNGLREMIKRIESDGVCP